MNHADEYKRWCLALWIARDLPSAARKSTPSLRKKRDVDIRSEFIARFEERHGRDPEFKILIADLWKQIRAGQEPVYTGAFEPAQIGRPPNE
jgi:hypothetical protein